MSKVKDKLNKLSEEDAYSLVLFLLFSLREVPEYATLSELSYVLDKKNLLRFCQYYGGLTIRIPTVDELKEVVYALAVYQQVNIEGQDLTKVLLSLQHSNNNLRHILKDYQKICDVLKFYNFRKK